MSDSGEDGPDDSICPACKKSTYVGETISCETCQYWFHFECVGVTHQDDCVKSEDVPYFCPPCSGKGPKYSPIKKSSKKPILSRKRKKESPVKSKPPKKVATPSSKQPLIEITPPPKVIQIPLTKKSQAPVKKSIVEEIQLLPPASLLFNENMKKKQLDSDEEEEEWLVAVESGNLHKIDEELKKIKDPKLMTARQRAMIIKKSEPGTPLISSSPQSPAIPAEILLNSTVNLDESGHMSLDYGLKKKTAAQEEADLEQRAIKSQKRRELELEKREHDKKKTIDRLLLKKDTKQDKTDKATTAKVEERRNEPKWTYTRKSCGATLLSLPFGVDFPLSGSKPKSPPKRLTCSVDECNKVKLYNCAKTGKPLCSLECYKKNLANETVLSAS